MTLSILAISPETGEAGFAQATSTPAIGERCTKVVHGRGVITYQCHGDYKRFGLARKLLDAGSTPAEVLAGLQDDAYFAYRQIGIIDMQGNIAVHTGDTTSVWAGEVVGPNHIATGNTLSGPKVVEAMSEAYMATAGEPFAERLLRSLEAGRDAGGQPDGQMSSAISIFDANQATLNLRVDVHPEPIGELRHLYNWYKPLIPYYVRYGLDPTSWSLDSWHALEESGAPLIPQAGPGWTPADIERRTTQIRKAPTTSAGKAQG